MKAIERKKQDLKELFVRQETKLAKTILSLEDPRSLGNTKQQTDYIINIRQRMDRINRRFENELNQTIEDKQTLRIKDWEQKRAPTRVDSKWSKKKWELVGNKNDKRSNNDDLESVSARSTPNDHLDDFFFN